MSYLYKHPLRWLRVLNPWITRNMKKAVRYAHRRVDRASLVRQCCTPGYNAKTRGLLLLTTVLAESFDDYGTPIEPENITTIRKVEDLEEMLSDAGEKLVVIFCMVRWCPFCKQITPTVEEIAAKRSEDLVMLKLDLDDEETESSRIVGRYDAYYIQQGALGGVAVGLPTFVFIKDREKLEHFTGADVRRLKGAVARYI